MSGRRQALFWLASLVLVGVLVYFLRGILLPFVAGMAVAYLLDPAADKLEDWGLSRTLATTVLTAVFFSMVAGLILVLYPVLQNQVVGFVTRLPQYVADARDWLVPLIALVAERLPFIESSDQVVEAATGLTEKYTGVLASAAGRLWSGGLAFFNLVSLVLITPVVAFYLLRDWDEIVGRIDGLMPRRQAPVIREQLGRIDKVLAGFVRGQTLVSLSLGVIYAIGLTAVGLEFGLVIGLGTGILSFVPFVGMVLGLATALVVGLLQWGLDPGHLALLAAVFATGQILESAVLQPRLLGGSVGLHPVWGIFGVLAGGALFGFVGVLLAVPMAAAVGVLVRFSVDQYHESALYQDGQVASDDPPVANVIEAPESLEAPETPEAPAAPESDKA
ncbi:MAG: AI-2E family transporter [Alphaproteobacteria bacterium]|nr:AI-2E family transporter [Alphaproteobacteria bacterium]